MMAPNRNVRRRHWIGLPGLSLVLLACGAEDEPQQSAAAGADDSLARRLQATTPVAVPLHEVPSESLDLALALIAGLSDTEMAPSWHGPVELEPIAVGTAQLNGARYVWVNNGQGAIVEHRNGQSVRTNRGKYDGWLHYESPFYTGIIQPYVPGT